MRSVRLSPSQFIFKARQDPLTNCLTLLMPSSLRTFLIGLIFPFILYESVAKLFSPPYQSRHPSLRSFLGLHAPFWYPSRALRHQVDNYDPYNPRPASGRRLQLCCRPRRLPVVLLPLPFGHRVVFCTLSEKETRSATPGEWVQGVGGSSVVHNWRQSLSVGDAVVSASQWGDWW